MCISDSSLHNKFNNKMIDFQKILPDQSALKVVLNGGRSVLENATVPFKIGFDPSVADRKPTHVLVITLPYVYYENNASGSLHTDPRLNLVGERQIFDLTTLDFIQFHKPGKQNIIFVLLKDPSKYTKDTILQKASLGSFYKYNLNFDDISKDSVSGLNILGYCEELVDVPKEFFAIRPKSGLKKHWHSWVNRWYRYPTVDQCLFRKRVPLALTVQLAVWLTGFLIRLVVVCVMNVFYLSAQLVMFVFGQQMLIQGIGKALLYLNYEFLFLYRISNENDYKEKLKMMFDGDYMLKYKVCGIGKYRIGIPISIWGIATQSLFWFMLCFIYYYVYKGELLTFGGFVSGVLLSILVPITTYFVITSMPYNKMTLWKSKDINGNKEESNLWHLALGGGFVFVIYFVYMAVPWIAMFKGIGLFLFTYWKPVLCVVTIILFKLFAKKLLKDYYKRVLTSLWVTTGIVLLLLLFSVYFQRNEKTINVNYNTTVVNYWYVVLVGLVVVLTILFKNQVFSVLLFIERYLKKFFSFLGKIISLIGSKIKFKVNIKSPVLQPVSATNKKLSRVDWFKQNMNLNSVPEKVDFKKPIIAPTKKETIVLNFKVAFWRTKSKVCRPYTD